MPGSGPRNNDEIVIFIKSMFNFKYKAFLSELGTISRGVGAGPCVQSCGHGPGLELALAEV